MYYQFWIILVFMGIAGAMFGVYMQKSKDKPTWKAHFLQIGSIFLIMIFCYLFGHYTVQYWELLQRTHTIFWFVLFYYTINPVVFWIAYNFGRLAVQ